MVLSLGQWLALAAAHDRRHLWLAMRVLEAPGFPAPAGAGQGDATDVRA